MVFANLDVKDYPEFLKKFNETYPEGERRLYKSAEHIANYIKMKGGKFHGFAFDDGNEDYLGYISYWTLNHLVYIEHLAVGAKHGKNVERKLLSHLFEMANPNALIEVEDPASSREAAERVEFLEKEGFRLRKDINFVQPNKVAMESGVKIMLMTHGDVDLKDTRELREMLTDVYNINAGI